MELVEMRDISLGYNVSDNGIYTPAIGDVVRGTTATYIAQDGLLKTAPPNVARVDYTNGVAELLLEPSSTNKIDESNGNTFSLGRCSRGSSKSVLGEVDGFEYSFTSASPVMSKVVSDSTLGFKTLSIYVDGNASDYFNLKLATFSNGGYGASVVFTPSTKSFSVISENSSYVQNSSASFVNLGNQIYRISLTTEYINTDNNIFALVYFGNYSNVFIGGVQLESTNFVTSYIPTNGGTVSRSADNMTNFGSSQIIDSNSGVLFFEFSVNIDSNFKKITLYKDSNNRIEFFVANTFFNFTYSTQGSDKFGFSNFSFVNPTNLKIVLKYNNTSADVYLNGQIIGSKTFSSLSVSNPLDRFNFDNGANGNLFFGRVRQVKHLPYNTDISKL